MSTENHYKKVGEFSGGRGKALGEILEICIVLLNILSYL
jgi:hypothetical protein